MLYVLVSKASSPHAERLFPDAFSIILLAFQDLEARRQPKDASSMLGAAIAPQMPCGRRFVASGLGSERRSGR